MQVEQAIFTSTGTSKVQGYHLVARSAGIDDRLAQSLAHWGPTHASLLEARLDASSLNYFSAGDGWLAVSRTVYGGPEYSGRGGMQVVTLFLALRSDQLAGYDFNVVSFARAGLALGHLRLLPALGQRLTRLDVPDRSLLGCPASSSPHAVETLQSLLELLDRHSQIAVLGHSQPLAILDYLIQQIPPEQRLMLSFTTGLRPSLHRRFRIHLLPKTDDSVRAQLDSLGITCVTPQT
jgi:hypothetical protein